MRCELCRKEIKQDDLVVPVGVFDRFPLASSYVADVEAIIPKTQGIHVDCLKEIVDVVRSWSLTGPSLPHRVVVTEESEDSEPEST